MNNLRKILLLLLPAFVVRPWLARRRISPLPPPGGVMMRLLFAILPYAFTAILSVRKESDRRLVKYFLPYGKMKNFVSLAYGIKVGDGAADRGAARTLRAVMPYGLVLWWDAETARAASSTDAAKPSSVKSAKSPEETYQETARLDKIEALTLRLLILRRNESLSAS